MRRLSSNFEKIMRTLDDTEILAVSGGNPFAHVATAIWQGVVGNLTYDAIKAMVNSVPQPRPLGDQEIARIKEAAESIRSSSPSSSSGASEHSMFSAFSQGLPNLIRQLESEFVENRW
jgi:hypothetical protein